jgi:hypothetical protein
MSADIVQRVENLMMGFSALFDNSSLHTLTSVCQSAVNNTMADFAVSGMLLESEGYEQQKRIITYTAAKEVLLTIHGIFVSMPKRRRMEVGIEVEMEDFSKQLDALNKAYDKQIEKAEKKQDGQVQTFLLKPLI